MDESTDPPTYLILLIPLLFAIVFPLFWCFVCFITSRFGWVQFASRYATEEAPTSPWRFGESARIGLFTNYNKVLNIALDDKGVFLELLVIFRPGHARLLVPWSEVLSIEKSKFGLFTPVICLKLKAGRRQMICTIPPRKKDELESYTGLTVK